MISGKRYYSKISCKNVINWPQFCGLIRINFIECPTNHRIDPPPNQREHRINQLQLSAFLGPNLLRICAPHRARAILGRCWLFSLYNTQWCDTCLLLQRLIPQKKPVELFPYLGQQIPLVFSTFRSRAEFVTFPLSSSEPAAAFDLWGSFRGTTLFLFLFRFERMRFMGAVDWWAIRFFFIDCLVLQRLIV